MFDATWAVRPDYVTALHKQFAAGIEVDLTSDERTKSRQKMMAAMDSLPLPLRNFIHEYGQAGLVYNLWLRHKRNVKKIPEIIRSVEAAIEKRRPVHSVCLYSEHQAATAFLEELGL